MGIIPSHPSRNTLNSIPQPPQYVCNIIHSPPPSPFIYHAITFSYTYSTWSITISYSMIGWGVVRNVIAWRIRSYIDYNALVFLRVYYIPLPQNRVSIAFYWCFIYIYCHLFCLGVGWSVASLYIIPPLPPLFPVTCIILLPCHVLFPMISVKFLTLCYILVLKVKLQFIVLPLFLVYRYIFYNI